LRRHDRTRGINTPTPAQYTLLAALDGDTKLVVARPYRADRQLGESDYPAYLLALEVFQAAVPEPRMPPGVARRFC
jgi:hypothetical protein